MFQLPLPQHRVRYWLGIEHGISRYLNQLWPCLLTRVCVTRPLWVKYTTWASKIWMLTPHCLHSSTKYSCDIARIISSTLSVKHGYYRQNATQLVGVGVGMVWGWGVPLLRSTTSSCCAHWTTFNCVDKLFEDDVIITELINTVNMFRRSLHIKKIINRIFCYTLIALIYVGPRFSDEPYTQHHPSIIIK